MMGIQLNRPAYIYGNNQSILSNTSFPESRLSKKHHDIVYHVVRKWVARNEYTVHTYMSGSVDGIT